MTLICCAMRPSITMARDGGLVAREGHAMEIGFNGKMTVRMRSKYEWSLSRKAPSTYRFLHEALLHEARFVDQVSGAESADTICQRTPVALGCEVREPGAPFRVKNIPFCSGEISQFCYRITLTP